MNVLLFYGFSVCISPIHCHQMAFLLRRKKRRKKLLNDQNVSNRLFLAVTPSRVATRTGKTRQMQSDELSKVIIHVLSFYEKWDPVHVNTREHL